MAVKVTAKCDTCGTVVFPSWKFVHQIPDTLPCPICQGPITVMSKEYVPVNDFPVTVEGGVFMGGPIKVEEVKEEEKHGKTRKGYYR